MIILALECSLQNQLNECLSTEQFYAGQSQPFQQQSLLPGSHPTEAQPLCHWPMNSSTEGEVKY